MEDENKVIAEISAKLSIEPNGHRNIELALDGDSTDMLVLVSTLARSLIKGGIEPVYIFAAIEAGVEGEVAELLDACTISREES